MSDRVDGVFVKVETKMLGAGGRVRVPSTLVTAEVVGPRGVTLSLRPRSSIGNLVSRLTSQRPYGEVGTRFDVVCDRPEVARVWLHEEVSRRLVATDGFRFRVTGDEVKAVHAGLVDDDAAVEAAKRAVAALALGPSSLVQAWRDAAKRIEGGRVSKDRRGWPRLRGHCETREVSASLQHHDEGLMTRVVADCGRADVEIDTAALKAVDARFELREGRATLHLRGICDDATRLVQCLELAASGGHNTTAGYR